MMKGTILSMCFICLVCLAYWLLADTVCFLLRLSLREIWLNKIIYERYSSINPRQKIRLKEPFKPEAYSWNCILLFISKILIYKFIFMPEWWVFVPIFRWPRADSGFQSGCVVLDTSITPSPILSCPVSASNSAERYAWNDGFETVSWKGVL